MCFKKDYTIDIVSNGYDLARFSCTFCKYNPKCWGLSCKLRKNLKKLNFVPIKMLSNWYRYVAPNDEVARNTLNELKEKFDTLYGDLFIKKRRENVKN